jgi:hypothetical protein
MVLIRPTAQGNVAFVDCPAGCLLSKSTSIFDKQVLQNKRDKGRTRVEEKEGMVGKGEGRKIERQETKPEKEGARRGSILQELTLLLVNKTETK